MIIYIFLLILILINIFVFKSNKKWFILFSFFELFIIAALRKYTVGIDLEGHYARNFTTIGEMDWGKIIKLIESKTSFYDFGLIVFMKLVSTICKSRQFFIIITSGITYGLIGRYIYKHSKNVYLETFIFITTYTYFMCMNIIAQGLALAIILNGIDYLKNKKYFKFTLFVLLANCIHSSAIICLLFIPLSFLKFKKRNIKIMIIISLIVILILDRILPIVLEYIYPQFAFYFKHKTQSGIDKMQLIHMMLYLMFFIISYIINFSTKINKVVDNENNGMDGFLFSLAILSVLIRYLGMGTYIFSRLGFYFYMFSYTLLVQSVERIYDKKIK